MLDQAFDALKTYNWGMSIKVLAPIDEAVNSTRGDKAARKDLENRLAAVLKSDAPRDAKDYVCRKLMIIGTAESVPTLAALLSDKDHSHMARYALERNPDPEAAKALRDALGKLDGALKIGVISSLGVRRDAESVKALAGLLDRSDAAVARAAACALGDIRNVEAVKALADAKAKKEEVQQAIADARLTCAEALLSSGKKTEAVVIYKSLAGEGQPKNVRLAATRGMLAGAGNKE
jgi:HEAT repeat protein